ncbi:hypothetical protein BAY61_00740 [Prauserella marina]|uniref:Septum formation n=1 Tax=Prauserella marina TaxID=530584 RepID=A0A222VJ59_9PSEU|nr:septum formation family protein [Prauserella marina]ASR33751.1 hypothetical protein BAY61_00740 [Prauserella marina]PWV82324.1 putative regulator of septum formation [Prauserella marina]SDC66336.1 Septum formation [Prauserella marina]
MPDESDQLSPNRRALRTRVLMVGVFIGAIVAMSLSWVFSWGFTSETELAQQAAQQTQEKKREAFSSPPGSCLTWTAADASDVRTVSCEEEHLFEVVGVADISDKFPKGARSPDDETWRELSEERCGTSAEEYLDKPLDPFGKLTVGVLRPDAEQWREGDRKLHCGIQRVAPGGELQPLEGKAADENQSDVWEEGTCLALDGKTVGDPVSCSEEHSYEIIGLVDLTKEFEEYPSTDDQTAWLDTECSRIAEKYTGGADLRDKGLILTWDLREQESWDAGSTLVNCKVAAKLEDDSGLAPVRGSIGKEEKPPESEAPKESEGNSEGNSGGQEPGGQEQGEPSEANGG